MRSSLPFTAFALFLAAPVAADEKSDADLKAMVGKWKVEKAVMAGKDVTERVASIMKFEIREGGKYTTQIGDQKEEGAFTIDPTKSPKEVDVKPTGGPNKGKTVKAIYKLDGDTFTACYNFDADKGARPEKFESKEGTTHLLIVYKREK
ncbi:MAG: TIGR03067 domain-containing protein [Planctomycetes bacterium]|nr:TIGR03067 domain-containing protein [Planctomycetota bacterium]